MSAPWKEHPEMMLLRLRLFLKTTGWELRSDNDRLEVWRADETTTSLYEIVLHKQLSNIGRVADIERALLEVANRSENSLDEITKLVSLVAYDRISFRIHGPHVTDIGIPLSSVDSLLDGVRGAMVAAAKDVARSRQKERRPGLNSKTYPHDAVFGHTSPGSYIVQVLHSLEDRPDETEPVLVDAEGEETGPTAATRQGWLRLVGLKLQSAAEFSAALSRNGQNAEVIPLQNCLQAGLNHDMALSIRKIMLSDSGPTSISCSYTPAFSPGQNESSCTVIEQPAIERLQVIAERLSEAPPPEPIRISGRVIGVASYAAERGGTAKIQAVLPINAEGLVARQGESSQLMPRIITAVMAREDYQLAIDAHRGDRDIQASGILEREGRSFLMRYQDDVRVLDSSQWTLFQSSSNPRILELPQT